MLTAVTNIRPRFCVVVRVGFIQTFILEFFISAQPGYGLKRRGKKYAILKWSLAGEVDNIKGEILNSISTRAECFTRIIPNYPHARF